MKIKPKNSRRMDNNILRDIERNQRNSDRTLQSYGHVLEWTGYSIQSYSMKNQSSFIQRAKNTTYRVKRRRMAKY